MKDGDIWEWPSASRQIIVVHNLKQTITFWLQDFAKIQMPHKDPLVVTLKISNCLVKKVLVDGGNAVEITLYSTFK